MKEMFKALNEARKEDPKEFWGGIIAVALTMLAMSVGFWLVGIIEGNV
jgi:hypothetical protein